MITVPDFTHETSVAGLGQKMQEFAEAVVAEVSAKPKARAKAAAEEAAPAAEPAA